MFQSDDDLEDIRLEVLLSDPVALKEICNRGFDFVKEKVLSLGDALETPLPGFRRHFVAPLRSIQSAEWSVLSDGSAFSFDFQTGKLQINLGHVVSLMQLVHQKLTDARFAAFDPSLAPDVSEDAKLLRLLLFLFVLHEVRHISQGLGRYEDVQRLKSRFGSMIVGDFDVLADRDAARAYALINIVNDEKFDLQSYVENFAHALFFMAEYCFPAFKAPAEKPHKIARALGLVLMLSRVSVSLHRGRVREDHNGALPLDAALVVRIADDWASITILAYSPEIQILTLDAPVDAERLRALCLSLDQGDADSLVRQGILLLRDLRLV